MKKKHSLLIAIGITAASLTSCSRSSYTFNTNVPAYLGATQVRSVATPAPASVKEAKISAAVAVVPTTAAPMVLQQELTQAVAVAPVTKQAPPYLVQRVLIKKLAKQLDKAQVKHQNAARTEHTAASKTGRAAIISLAGLLLILLGAATGVGIIAVIGIIAFIVGIVLVVVNLVNGD